MTYEILTEAERETLDAAAEIIRRHTAYGSSWQIDFAHYRNCDPSFGVTYFDSNEGSARGQHYPKGETFADKVQSVVRIEASAASIAEATRSDRINKLRNELASLTGEAA